MERNPRPFVLLAVVLAHGMLAILLMRARLALPIATKSLIEPLIIEFLPRESRETVSGPSKRTAARPLQRRTRSEGELEIEAPSTTRQELSAVPQVDWAHEAEQSILNNLSQAERESRYRNLAGLSQAQLEWLRRNQFEPMPPEFHWDHSYPGRIEVQNGVPILHINDHCVLVAMIIPFCKIGHIEPNGNLFEHMRDPRDPTP